MTKVAEQVAAAFAACDAAMHEFQQDWAKARRAAYKALEAERGAKLKSGELRFNTQAFREASAMMTRVVGGKTWENKLIGWSEAQALENVRKHTQGVIDKRNARLVKALEKEGVTEVRGEALAKYSDGFHGTYTLATDSGTKTLTIDTIFAGGHSIQCLHTRTLTKVR